MDDPSPTTSTALHNRVCGALLGLAAGDRNGGPTAMAHALAASLLAEHAFSPNDIRQRYVRWWQQGGFDSGPVAAQVLTLLGQGMAPTQATLIVHQALHGRTAGCNPAHRAVPLAMAGFLSDHALGQIATTEAALTHWDRLAGDVAAVTVSLARALIRGQPWSQALATQQIDAFLDTRLGQKIAMPPERRDGFAPVVLHAALFFLDTHTSFVAALDAALHFAGPANYCPVLVGALGGARWGAGQIPPETMQHCMLLPTILSHAEALTNTWLSS